MSKINNFADLFLQLTLNSNFDLNLVKYGLQ